MNKRIRKKPPLSRQDRRQYILDNAARLFSSGGYAATSLRDIASACGIRASSLYYHFESKDEIVTEVLRIGVQRVFDEVRSAVAALPANIDARTLLGTAISAHLSALLELHDYTSANVRIFGQVPEKVRRPLITLRDDYEQFWASIFNQCQTAANIAADRDLHLTRLFLINAMNGCLEWYHSGPASLDQLSQELTDLFLNGLLAPAKSPSADFASAKPKRTKKNALNH